MPSVLTIEILNQDQWWMSPDRAMVQLTELRAGHRWNILQMFRRNSAVLRKKLDPADTSPGLSDEEWIAQFPLIKELTRLHNSLTADQVEDLRRENEEYERRNDYIPLNFQEHT